MTTKEFAKKVYEMCVIEVYDYWIDFLEKDDLDLKMPLPYIDFRRVYRGLDEEQKKNLRHLIKKISVDSTSMFCSILDNRAVGDFEEDFTLMSNNNIEPLNNFALQDEFQNSAYDWSKHDIK